MCNILGGYRTSGTNYAFLLSGALFTSFDFPGAGFTTATGISPGGDIVGRYTVNKINNGFFAHFGQFSTIDFPGQSSASYRD